VLNDSLLVVPDVEDMRVLLRISRRQLKRGTKAGCRDCEKFSMWKVAQVGVGLEGKTTSLLQWILRNTRK